MNATQIVPRTMQETQESFRQWMTGFDAYADGAQYDEAQCRQWRQGWRDARAGEAEFLTAQAFAPAKPAHVLTDAECAALTDEYADDIADREWHSRGGW